MSSQATPAVASKRDLNSLPGRSPTTSNPFVFPGADIRMLMTYKGKAIIALVSSHVLICASPVWKKFLFPPWVAASVPVNSPKQIDCSEDDGVALLIILNIIHLRHKEVLLRLEPDTLLQVAVLCDQYDCAGIVKHWISIWMKETEANLVAKHFVPPQILFVCWVFGLEDNFEALTIKLVMELRTDDEGIWRSKRGWRIVVPDTMPEGIMENIHRIRVETIEALLSVPYSAMARFKRTKTVLCQMSHISSDDSLCDAITLGSITRGLDVSEVEYRTKAIDVHMSVEEVAAAIDDIHVYHVEPSAARPLVDHSLCHARNFQHEVAKVLRIMESPVELRHRQHMRVQNSKM
ncbi:hypothetical protein BKA65DRAFT_582335 [Rhexocercosporidium sp. MPI-PUGE-AT-0058]|nr:hypothetical protein BKA65DRAFT_582335 [Rhexocercosporidium sp. MPI-PUGE-AT-0058]